MQNNISKFTVAFIISLVVIGVLFAQEVGILVAPNGNVGIGTENPTAALEVNGRIKDKTGFIMPVGTILPYGGETAPEGWLLCNGDAKSRTDFADLFAAIGTNFGQGDGSATFNVPDLRGRFPRGGEALGATGGSETHNHTVDIWGSNKTGSFLYEGTTNRTFIGAYNSLYSWWRTDSGAVPHVGKRETTAVASNLPPYIEVHYIIKY
jgi:microcystin-dependent protein